MPAILTKRTATTVSIEKNENNTQIDNKEEKQNYEYTKYKTIDLLHKSTGEIEKVNLDDYLCNVVSAEMPADYEIEAL